MAWLFGKKTESELTIEADQIDTKISELEEKINRLIENKIKLSPKKQAAIEKIDIKIQDQDTKTIDKYNLLHFKTLLLESKPNQYLLSEIVDIIKQCKGSEQYYLQTIEGYMDKQYKYIGSLYDYILDKSQKNVVLNPEKANLINKPIVLDDYQVNCIQKPLENKSYKNEHEPPVLIDANAHSAACKEGSKDITTLFFKISKLFRTDELIFTDMDLDYTLVELTSTADISEQPEKCKMPISKPNEIVVTEPNEPSEPSESSIGGKRHHHRKIRKTRRNHKKRRPRKSHRRA